MYSTVQREKACERFWGIRARCSAVLATALAKNKPWQRDHRTAAKKLRALRDVIYRCLPGL